MASWKEKEEVPFLQNSTRRCKRFMSIFSESFICSASKHKGNMAVQIQDGCLISVMLHPGAPEYICCAKSLHFSFISDTQVQVPTVLSRISIVLICIHPRWPPNHKILPFFYYKIQCETLITSSTVEKI